MPTTHAADATDRFDPWGFGTTAADEPSVVIAFGPPDDADDLDADVPTDETADADDAVMELVSRLSTPISVTALAAADANPAESLAAPVAPAAPVAKPTLWRRPASMAQPDAALEGARPAAIPVPAAASAPFAPADSARTGLAPFAGSAAMTAVAAPTHMPMPAAVASPATSSRPFSRDMAAVLAICALVILGQALYIGLSLTGEVRASAAPTGDLVLSSHPAGARVTIDGQDRGVTPLVLSVPVGKHRVALAGAAGVAQSLDADITEGAKWVRHLVLAPAVTDAPSLGALRIESGAAGAAVWLDGTQVGRTPLTLTDIAAGAHAVRVQFAAGAPVDRRVTLAAGETMSLVLDAPAARAAVPAGPASGWVSVETSFDVQVTEGGHVIGSSESERIMVTAGPHVFELANAALGYKSTVKVVVGAGRTAPLVVDTPRTPVQVNAQPWAEVLVDGRVLGETPLANLMLPIGPHQFVFRHPEFGERVQAVTVRLNTPNRVTADLRK